MKLVVDTNVLVTALRSPAGASAEVLRLVLRGRLAMAASIPIFLEYEAVLKRPEHLARGGIDSAQVDRFLAALAGVIEPVTIRFLWRPILRDPNDDMVLEAAVNGRVDAIVTFNRRDFLPQALRFGLEILAPADVLERL